MGWFGRSNEDYREEIGEHIELETQANIDRGMSPEEARRAAHIAFGSVSGVRQGLHEGRRSYRIGALVEDVRYGVRMIRRSPLLSITVVLTLSIGIGLMGGGFSVASSYAFTPQVRTDPQSFVQFMSLEAGNGPQVATVPRYERFVRENHSMRELAAWSIVPTIAQLGSTDSARVQGVAVSCNFFSVFEEVPPVLGRFFQKDDCALGQSVAVISARIWRERFSSDPRVIGKTVDYGGNPISIVGVTVPPLAGELFADVWVPYTLRYLKQLTQAFGGDDPLTTEDFFWLGMAGRLRPGVSRSAAASEFRVLISREDHPIAGMNYGMKLSDASLWSMAPLQMLGMFSFVLAFPTLALLIVCATAATLLLSRAVGRQREMAIRLALGGSKLRLVRLLLVETLILSALAAAVSLVFVYTLPPVIFRFLYGSPQATRFPTLDWTVFVYLGVVTLFAAVCAGISPALESLNLQLGETLKGRHLCGRYRGPTRLRSVLVASQIAFSMVPFVVAVTLARSESVFTAPGFEAQHVVTAVPESLKGESSRSLLTTNLQSVPAVRSVAYAATLPLVFEEALVASLPERSPEPLLSAYVSPDYFQTLDIPILAGRAFEAADETLKTNTRPIVVSQQFVRRFFADQNPLGKTIQGPALDGRNQKRYVIVGVARDRAAGFGPFRSVNDGTFVYQLAEASRGGYFLVRFDGDVTDFTRALQSALKQSTGLMIPVTLLQTSIEQRTMRFHGFRTLLWLLGLIVLALSLIGVFGVLSLNVVQRGKELAIRASLGAVPADIFRTIIRFGVKPMPVGLAAGTLLSFAALKFAESQRITPLGLVSRDPIPYVAAAALLLLTTLAVIVYPAYRATSLDPVDALREE